MEQLIEEELNRIQACDEFFPNTIWSTSPAM